ALAAAVDALAAADPAGESIDVVADAALAVQRLRNRLDAVGLGLLAAVDARQGYQRDGAVTTASWLRHRANLDFGRAGVLVQAARRLRGLPLLAAHLSAGDVTIDHVAAVTRAQQPAKSAAEAAAAGQVADLTAALAVARSAPPPRAGPPPTARYGSGVELPADTARRLLSTHRHGRAHPRPLARGQRRRQTPHPARLAAHRARRHAPPLPRPRLRPPRRLDPSPPHHPLELPPRHRPQRHPAAVRRPPRPHHHQRLERHPRPHHRRRHLDPPRRPHHVVPPPRR
ncbi:MAG: DUF222 domain-containing protein, partial [Euzebyaceae bacterium]|nr:DUF222 domain-containing protein [Euzebyaceae bacterium]